MGYMTDLLQKDEKSLRHEVLDLRRELLNLRFQHRSKELKNVSDIRRVRRQVARVKTALVLHRIQKKEG